MPSFEGLLMVTKIELNWIDHDWSLLTCDNWQLDLNPRHIDDFTTWQFQLDWFSVAKRGGHWTTSSEADLGYASIKQWSMGGGLAKLGIATGWQTNARTHTHKIIHDHGFWMRWRILLIGKDVSMVPFIDLMILTWLSFVSGVFNV